jgi:hypothetical protein
MFFPHQRECFKILRPYPGAARCFKRVAKVSVCNGITKELRKYFSSHAQNQLVINVKNDLKLSLQ